MAHILIVDDDEEIRILLSEILRQAGHTVLTANNGQTGLETIKTKNIDLVITDIFMPEMDGIDLLVSILNTYPNSKIIAISGGHKAMNAQLTLKMAQSFGAVDVITKPFQANVLINKIERALHSMDIRTKEDMVVT